MAAANPGFIHPPRPGQETVLNGLHRLLVHARYDRLVIVGGPGSGKTTLAEKLGESIGHRVRTSQELEQHPSLAALPKADRWSGASELQSRWFDEPGPWIVEGVQAARALRKWLKRNDAGKPADAALWLAHPVESRTRHHHAMAAGVETVWKEIRGELRKRGMTLLEAED